jgi:hypothetical protein
MSALRGGPSVSLTSYGWAHLQGVGDGCAREHPAVLGTDVCEADARLGRAVADVLSLVTDGAVESAPREDAARVHQGLGRRKSARERTRAWRATALRRPNRRPWGFESPC